MNKERVTHELHFLLRSCYVFQISLQNKQMPIETIADCVSSFIACGCTTLHEYREDHHHSNTDSAQMHTLMKVVAESYDEICRRIREEALTQALMPFQFTRFEMIFYDELDKITDVVMGVYTGANGHE